MIVMFTGMERTPVNSVMNVSVQLKEMWNPCNAIHRHISLSTKLVILWSQFCCTNNVDCVFALEYHQDMVPSIITNAAQSSFVSCSAWPFHTFLAHYCVLCAFCHEFASTPVCSLVESKFCVMALHYRLVPLVKVLWQNDVSKTLHTAFSTYPSSCSW